MACEQTMTIWSMLATLGRSKLFLRAQDLVDAPLAARHFAEFDVIAHERRNAFLTELAARLAGIELPVRAFNVVKAAQRALYSSSHGCGSPPEVRASP